MHSIVHGLSNDTQSAISIVPDTNKARLLNEIKQMKGQKIIYLNVRSVYRHISEIQLDFEDTNFICLAFTESWLTSNINSNIISLKGFKHVRLDRQIKKRGGGLIIYIREDLEWEYLGAQISTSDIELLTILVKRKYQRNLCISVSYLPPTSNVNLAIDKLDELGRLLENTTHEWVLGGDFNIDMLATSQTRAKRLLNNFAVRYSITQVITCKTRISKTCGSLLDHIYVSDNNNVHDSGTVAYGMSDHYITFINLKRNLEKKDKVSFTCRKMRGYNRDELLNLLENQDYSEFYENTDPNIGWNQLYQIYLRCLDIIVPLIEVYNVNEASPWINAELLDLVRDRDVKKLKCDKVEINDSFEEFKKLRNKVHREVIKAKRNHVRNCLNKLDPSTKKYWAELNKVAPLSKKKDRDTQGIFALKTTEGTIVKGIEMTNYLNDYFVSIGKSLADKCTYDNNCYLNQCKLPKSQDVLTEWTEVSEAEVEILIENMDVSKNSNIDNINAFLLKECLLCSVNKVRYLFNCVLHSGKFPDEWKRATIVPLFKGGDRLVTSNYRPISLLSALGKIMEKLLHKRILQYLNSFNFFTECQGGFRPSLGTTDTLDKFLNYIYDNINNNSLTLTIYFDLKKAFDTVNHDLLLAKLEGAGIMGNCLELLKNYLSDRYQRCRIDLLMSLELPYVRTIPLSWLEVMILQNYVQR